MTTMVPQTFLRFFIHLRFCLVRMHSCCKNYVIIVVILQGKFTTKSDVWSFAVTLWEVLTFAKDQPYDALTDEMVIENAGHYYRNDKQEVYLSHPPNCPKEIYDLMCECWNRSESARPTFREIHMFLQRKNMGYNPKDEKMNQIKVPIC